MSVLTPNTEISPIGAQVQFVIRAMHDVHVALSTSSSYITSILRFLVSNGAPLLANVYTYFSYMSDTNGIDLSYALFMSPI